MALNNFFSINLPYGIIKNEKNEWACFNREYKPLGNNNIFEEFDSKDLIYSKYKGLTEKTLQELADSQRSTEYVNGKIVRIFFYSGSTNPSNFSDKQLYNRYFKKIEILSKLKV